MIDRYKNNVIENIFSDLYRFQLYCDIEIYYLNLLYKKILKENKEYNTFILSYEDLHEIKQIEKKTAHEMAAVVEFLCKKVDPLYTHYGLTSSDVLDSAYTIQIIKSTRLFINDLQSLISLFDNLSGKYIDQKINLRTHGRIAEIGSLGSKLIKFFRKLQIQKDDLTSSLNENSYFKFYGPTGNFSILDNINSVDYLMRVLCSDLSKFYNIDDVKINLYRQQNQCIDRIFYYKIFLSIYQTLICLKTIVQELRLLSQDGIDEFSEYKKQGQKGSSSMPHKSNPIMLENTDGLLNTAMSSILSLEKTCFLWNERDMTHSSMERILVPQIFHLCMKSVSNLLEIFSTGKFEIENINTNIDKNIEKTMSSRKLNDLIHLYKKNRLDAYKIIEEQNK